MSERMEPEIVDLDYTAVRQPCPTCGTSCRRHGEKTRSLMDLGATAPRILQVTYNNYHCKICRKYFARRLALAAPSMRYSERVRARAVAMVLDDGLTLQRAEQRMARLYHVEVPHTTLHEWVRDARYPDSAMVLSCATAAETKGAV